MSSTLQGANVSVGENILHWLIAIAITFSLVLSVHEFAMQAIIAFIVLLGLAAIHHLASSHRSLTLRMMMFWRSSGDVQ